MSSNQHGEKSSETTIFDLTTEFFSVGKGHFFKSYTFPKLVEEFSEHGFELISYRYSTSGNYEDDLDENCFLAMFYGQGIVATARIRNIAGTWRMFLNFHFEAVPIVNGVFMYFATKGGVSVIPLYVTRTSLNTFVIQGFKSDSLNLHVEEWFRLFHDIQAYCLILDKPFHPTLFGLHTFLAFNDLMRNATTSFKKAIENVRIERVSPASFYTSQDANNLPIKKIEQV